MIDKRPKTPREVAAFSLFSMAEEAAWSDGALHHYLSRAGLDSRDAALASRLTYGTVQNQILLDWYLRHFSSVRLKKIAPRVLACLRMGLYQLILMDKIPAHAAVAETVALVKHYGHANDRTVAFANAVLRNAANAAQNGSLPRLNCPDKESYYALQYSHPEWLVRLLSEQYGQKLTQKICQADNADAPISVRVNTMKCTPAEAQAELEAAGLTVQPHEAFPEILLCSGGDAAALPAFIEGRVTVQDAASALAAAVADPKPGSTVLDCCAAPGGKSFAMAEKMQGKGSVTSCDIYEHKLKRIRDGAARLGLPNIRTELQDASVCREEWKDSADVVLCDVPCSGLGVLGRRADARWSKEAADIAGLCQVQRQILEQAAQLVAPGGTLIYSTCTITPEENIQMVRQFLEQHPQFMLDETLNDCWLQVEKAETGYVQFLPFVDDMDGFFIARMLRKEAM